VSARDTQELECGIRKLRQGCPQFTAWQAYSIVTVVGVGVAGFTVVVGLVLDEDDVLADEVVGFVVVVVLVVNVELGIIVIAWGGDPAVVWLKTFSRALLPQSEDESPAHGMLQSVSGACDVASKLLPQ